jgi:hypothetical protein
MKIKTTLRFHLTSVGMAKEGKTQQTLGRMQGKKSPQTLLMTM